MTDTIMEENKEVRLIVCTHERMGNKPSCGMRGSRELATLLGQAIAERGLPVPVVEIKCLGNCHDGPNIRIAPGGAYFSNCTAETIPTILQTLETALQEANTPPDETNPALLFPQF